MPVCSLHLISLHPTTSVSSFIPDLYASAVSEPILIARPLRWMIAPWIAEPSGVESNHVAMLNNTEWSILVIFPSLFDIPEKVRGRIAVLYSLQTGISSKILANLGALNKNLLDPSTPKPPLTGSLDKPPTATSSKDLELTDDLLSWFSSPSGLKTPPSMLNLLTFNPGKHKSYVSYGQAFAKDVGKQRGGLAKIVGSVIGGDGQAGEAKVWDEIAVAHYPSVWHFADMIMSEDYRTVNAKYRIGALRGTCILCCDELDSEVLEGKKVATKLPRGRL